MWECGAVLAGGGTSSNVGNGTQPNLAQPPPPAAAGGGGGNAGSGGGSISSPPGTGNEGNLQQYSAIVHQIRTQPHLNQLLTRCCQM